MCKKNKPEGRMLRLFTTSPDAGPDCPCSLCGEPILEAPVTRAWDEERPEFEARFHHHCGVAAFAGPHDFVIDGRSRYFYRLRPPGIGCQPDGFIEYKAFEKIREVATLPGRYHGWVDYPEPLSLYDAWRMDLDPADEVERARMTFFVDYEYDEEKAEKMIELYLNRGVTELRKDLERLGNTKLTRAALVIARDRLEPTDE